MLPKLYWNFWLWGYFKLSENVLLATKNAAASEQILKGPSSY